MEVEMLEDDVFFAELSKQVALLITDDEEEFPVQCPAIPVPGFSFAHVPHVASMPATYTLCNQVASYNNHSNRSREVSSSKGTGVFIPRSSPNATLPRRKSKSSRTHSPNSIASTTAHSLQTTRQAAAGKLVMAPRKTSGAK